MNEDKIKERAEEIYRELRRDDLNAGLSAYDLKNYAMRVARKEFTNGSK